MDHEPEVIRLSAVRVDQPPGQDNEWGLASGLSSFCPVSFCQILDDVIDLTERYGTERWNKQNQNGGRKQQSTGSAESQRVLNRKSVVGTNRFEKRWLRPTHSKCLNFPARCISSSSAAGLVPNAQDRKRIPPFTVLQVDGGFCGWICFRVLSALHGPPRASSGEIVQSTNAATRSPSMRTSGPPG